MLFTTPTQYIALAVALVAGWLFGLASHPGGRKWKTRYAAERDAHAVTTKRVTELERENTRLAQATPVVEERVVHDTHPLPDDRVIRDDRVVRDERFVGDARVDGNDRITPRSSAAPAHPRDGY